MSLLTVYRSRSLRRSERFRWRLVADNGRTVATSGEGYSNYDEALHMGKMVAGGHFSDHGTSSPGRVDFHRNL